MCKDFKFLLITPSYKRPYMLRACIQNALNQTYTNFYHSIVINQDADQLYNYKLLYDDLIPAPKNIFPGMETPPSPEQYIISYKTNEDQHVNYIAAIAQAKANKQLYDSIDYIVKWDDDEIMRSQYLSGINDFINMHPGYNIYSTKVSSQVNNYHLNTGQAFSNLGGVPDFVGMPATLVFDKKAAEMILPITPGSDGYQEFRGRGFEDTAWINYWNEKGLKFKLNETPNDEYIWHVHGGKVAGEGNISISNWVRD